MWKQQQRKVEALTAHVESGVTGLHHFGKALRRLITERLASGEALAWSFAAGAMFGTVRGSASKAERARKARARLLAPLLWWRLLLTAS